MLLIHAGYAKTGTTTLQKNLFFGLNSIVYLGRHYPVPSPVSPNLIHKLVGMKNLAFDNLLETLQCYLYDQSGRYDSYAHQLANKIKALPKEKVKLISHENILRPTHIEETALRLRELFSGMDIKILFTIRRQQDIIMSRLYHDRDFFDLSSGNLMQNLSLEIVDCNYPICNWVKSKSCYQTCSGRRKLSLPYYDYDSVVSIYERIFGPDNVEVLTFEKIIRSDNDHTKRLGKLLNIDQTALSALISQFPVSNKATNLDQYNKFKSLFKDECGAYLSQYYMKCNTQLSERYHLGLEEYNYI